MLFRAGVAWTYLKEKRSFGQHIYCGGESFLQKRRRRDLNPRAPKDNLISSQARYGHFATSP